MLKFRIHWSRRATTRPVPRRRLSDQPERSTDLENTNFISESYISQPNQQFRRNQTLTGSTSLDVSSAAEHSNFSSLQSERTMTHHLRHRQRRLGLWLLGALLLAGATMLILYEMIASVQITYSEKTVDSTDSSMINHYEQLTQGYLKSRPLERLRPFFNSASFVSYLSSNGAAEVSSVASVRPAGLGSAVISLKMRQPVVTWKIGATTEYVDDTGTIFRVNHYKVPSITVIDESGIETNDLATITSSRFLQFIGQGVGFANTEKLLIKQVILPADTTRQVQFVIDNKLQTRIKLSVDRPAGEQIEDAYRAYTYLEKNNISARYIDVRVSGEAFYMTS